MNGTDILVLVDGVAVGSQRDASFDESTAEIDMSSKDAREGRVIAGRYGAKISMDALYVPSDAAYVLLKAAMRNGTLIQINRQEEGTILESADALVTALGEKAPDQDAAVVAIALTIDGAWYSGS